MPYDEMDTQMGVLDELKDSMDGRLVGRISKKKEMKVEGKNQGPDYAENKARADWVPGDGSEEGIEFSESGSDVPGLESSDSDYDEDEMSVMESDEYESLMG